MGIGRGASFRALRPPPYMAQVGSAVHWHQLEVQGFVLLSVEVAAFPGPVGQACMWDVFDISKFLFDFHRWTWQCMRVVTVGAGRRIASPPNPMII